MYFENFNCEYLKTRNLDLDHSWFLSPVIFFDDWVLKIYSYVAKDSYEWSYQKNVKALEDQINILVVIRLFKD